MKSSYNNQITYKDLLDSIVFIKNPETIFEFGILEGLSLTSFIENSNPSCKIQAYDIFEEFNGNAANKATLEESFAKYKNVTINYGDFFKKYIDIVNNSIDILHIDIANNGDVLEFAIEHYLPKLSENGILIFEGGSLDRDNVEWMLKYNKSKIQPVLEKYSNTYNIKTIGTMPSLTIIYQV